LVATMTTIALVKWTAALEAVWEAKATLER
jgi:hypothetical protein